MMKRFRQNLFKALNYPFILIFLLSCNSYLFGQIEDPPGNILLVTDTTGHWTGGNVGIGVGEPRQSLDVAGKIRVHKMDSVFIEHPVVIWNQADSTLDIIGIDSLTNIIQKYRTFSSTPFGTWVRDTANGKVHQAKLGDDIGIGTTLPSQQLEITGNFKLPVATDTSGIIYKGNDPWLHDFQKQGTFGGNIFIGKGAGNFALTGSATGSQGSYNTAIGSQSLKNLTTGQLNTAIGMMAMRDNTTGSYNVGIGYKALSANIDGSTNTAVGMFAMRNCVHPSGLTAVGYSSMQNNTTGFENSSLGYYALSECTEGNQNTAIGSNAMKMLTVGYANVAIGCDAMIFSSDSAVTNVAIGNSALSKSNRACNVAVGSSALKELTLGLDCIGIGTGALLNNYSGNENIGVGVYTMNDKISGDANTVVGQYALWKNVYGSTNTTLGNRTGYWNTGSGNVFIGDSAAYYETGSDKLYIDNSPTDAPLVYGDFAERYVRINGDLRITGNVFTTTTHNRTLSIPAGRDMQMNDTIPVFNFSEIGLVFPKDSAEQAIASMSMPSDWEAGTALDLSLSYVQNAATDTARWYLRYRIYNPGEAVPAWAEIHVSTVDHEYGTGSILQSVTFPSIETENINQEAVLDLIVFRSSTIGTDNELLLKQIKLNYQAGLIGINSWQ